MVKILVLAGSTRRGSLNKQLARAVAPVRPHDTVVVMSDLDRVPFYDGDVEAAGLPPAVRQLREAVAQADALVVVTPEYNGTVPGMLGNAIDWLSRPATESVLQGKPVVVLSASPSRYGGIRAAEHLRTVLGYIGADVAPVGLSVPAAHRRFKDGEPDPELATEVARVLTTALDRSDGRRPGDLALAV